MSLSPPGTPRGTATLGAGDATAAPAEQQQGHGSPQTQKLTRPRPPRVTSSPNLLPRQASTGSVADRPDEQLRPVDSVRLSPRSRAGHHRVPHSAQHSPGTPPLTDVMSELLGAMQKGFRQLEQRLDQHSRDVTQRLEAQQGQIRDHTRLLEELRSRPLAERTQEQSREERKESHVPDSPRRTLGGVDTDRPRRGFFGTVATAADDAGQGANQTSAPLTGGWLTGGGDTSAGLRRGSAKGVGFGQQDQDVSPGLGRARQKQHASFRQIASMRKARQMTSFRKPPPVAAASAATTAAAVMVTATVAATEMRPPTAGSGLSTQSDAPAKRVVTISPPAVPVLAIESALGDRCESSSGGSSQATDPLPAEQGDSPRKSRRARSETMPDCTLSDSNDIAKCVLSISQDDGDPMVAAVAAFRAQGARPSIVPLRLGGATGRGSVAAAAMRRRSTVRSKAGRQPSYKADGDEGEEDDESEEEDDGFIPEREAPSCRQRIQRVVLLPDGVWRIAWDVACLCVLFSEAVMVLLVNMVCAVPGASHACWYEAHDYSVGPALWRPLMSLFWLADAWVQVHTSLLDGWEVVDDAQELWRRRVETGQLQLDIVAAIPWDFFILLAGANTAFHWLSLLRLLHLGRVVSIFSGSSPIRSRPLYAEALLMWFWFLLTAHLCTCVWMMTASVDEQGADDNGTIANGGIPGTGRASYFDSLYFTITTLTSVGYGDISPKSLGLRLWNCVLQIIWVLLLMVLSGRIGAFFVTTDPFKLMLIERRRRLESLMENNKIPFATQREAFAIYPVLLDSSIADYREVLLQLPEYMRAKIMLHIKATAVEKVPMFSSLPKSVVACLADCLSEPRMPANEAFIRDGEPGSRMIILQHGVAEVLLDTEEGEICIATLQSGSWFGLTSLMVPTRRIACVRALTVCHLFGLERRDFNAVCSISEDLLRLRQQARDTILAAPWDDDPLAEQQIMRKTCCGLFQSERKFSPYRADVGTAQVDEVLQMGEDDAITAGVLSAPESVLPTLEQVAPVLQVEPMQLTPGQVPHSVDGAMCDTPGFSTGEFVVLDASASAGISGWRPHGSGMLPTRRDADNQSAQSPRTRASTQGGGGLTPRSGASAVESALGASVSSVPDDSAPPQGLAAAAGTAPVSGGRQLGLSSSFTVQQEIRQGNIPPQAPAPVMRSTSDLSMQESEAGTAVMNDIANSPMQRRLRRVPPPGLVQLDVRGDLSIIKSCESDGVPGTPCSGMLSLGSVASSPRALPRGNTNSSFSPRAMNAVARVVRSFRGHAPRSTSMRPPSVAGDPADQSMSDRGRSSIGSIASLVAGYPTPGSPSGAQLLQKAVHQMQQPRSRGGTQGPRAVDMAGSMLDSSMSLGPMPSSMALSVSPPGKKADAGPSREPEGQQAG
eukprot:TRINITY_DN15735_c0_g1_i1.p1 TRINITY_DN15735_c0_g1~~TRINITY_DN15735_c0_g1_i1.p1  ORF type:complete len:1429 (+),score=283.46 TRINITY_DN15735_c0_g1_i1:92-4288(+)